MANGSAFCVDRCVCFQRTFVELHAIAKRTGAPVFLTGIAVSPHILLNTWDKVMLGAPFGRGVVTWDGPYYIPADADEAAIAQLGQDWSKALSAVARKAEALAAQSPRMTA